MKLIIFGSILAVCLTSPLPAQPDPERIVLMCQDSPALATIRAACPEIFEATIIPKPIHTAIDDHGEGIVWKLARWIEFERPPVRNDRVEVPGYFQFRAKSHAAVLRGFWTYNRDPQGNETKDQWVWRTVTHVTAGDESDALRVDAQHFKKTGTKRIVTSPSQAHSNEIHGAEPIIWKGETIGWVATAWRADGGKFRCETRWMTPGKDDSLARSIENPVGIRNLRRPNVYEQAINWTFVLQPASSKKSADVAWPSSRPRFEIPPMESR